MSGAGEDMLRRSLGFNHYPSLGSTVQVLAPQQRAYRALVTSRPAEEVGCWGVRAVGPDGRATGAEERVHFSRLASTGAASWPEPAAASAGASGSAGGAAVRPGAPPDDARPLVAIVGAGLGGLAAAAAMQRWGARVRVYERDESFAERKQGYGLTMQQGGAALKALGAEELASRCICATLHTSFTSDGTLLGRYGHDARCAAGDGAGDGGGEQAGGKRKRSRAKGRNFLIPRQQLRQELLDRLEPGTVRWGCNFQSYREVAEGGDGVRLLFAPNRSGLCEPEAEAALLVGADGIFSRVSRQRLAAEHTALEYTGVLVVLGITTLESEELRGHELLAGSRTISETVDGSTRFYMMPFSSTQQMWQLSVPMAQEAAAALHRAGAAALRAEALRLCEGWHDPLPALLRATRSDDVTGYPVFDRAPLPPAAFRPHRHAADGWVTLLGDAIHPMAPFKGQGANQALLDGVLLADELKRSALGAHTHRSRPECSLLARKRGIGCLRRAAHGAGAVGAVLPRRGSGGRRGTVGGGGAGVLRGGGGAAVNRQGGAVARGHGAAALGGGAGAGRPDARGDGARGERGGRRRRRWRCAGVAAKLRGGQPPPSRGEAATPCTTAPMHNASRYCTNATPCATATAGRNLQRMACAKKFLFHFSARPS